MKTYLIIYNSLSGTNPEYSGLITAIKSANNWAKAFPFAWLIKTSLSSSVVAERLSKFLYKGDKILVIEVTKDWAAYGIDAEVIKWMKGAISSV